MVLQGKQTHPSLPPGDPTLNLQTRSASPQPHCLAGACKRGPPRCSSLVQPHHRRQACRLPPSGQLWSSSSSPTTRPTSSATAKATRQDWRLKPPLHTLVRVRVSVRSHPHRRLRHLVAATLVTAAAAFRATPPPRLRCPPSSSPALIATAPSISPSSRLLLASVPPPSRLHFAISSPPSRLLLSPPSRFLLVSVSPSSRLHLVCVSSASAVLPSSASHPRLASRDRQGPAGTAGASAGWSGGPAGRDDY